MKQLFRAVVLVLLVGGWSLAASAVHVVRTPTTVALLPKDQLSFHDTFLDTRKWTVTDDQAHPAVVARLVHLGRADLLRHTVPTDVPAPAADAMLAAIAASAPTPGVATSTAAGSVMRNAEGDAKAVVNLGKQAAGKL